MGTDTPHPGSFRKSLKRKRLEDTELGRMYGKLEDDRVCTPCPSFFCKDVILLELSGRRLLRM